MNRTIVAVFLALLLAATTVPAQQVRLLSHDLERTPSAATTKIQNDDGSFENTAASASSFGPFDGYAMRFDLTSDVVQQGVEYCFRNGESSAVIGFSFDVVLYPDTNNVPDDTVAGAGSIGTHTVDLPVGSSCHVVTLVEATVVAGSQVWWGATWPTTPSVGLEIDTSGNAPSFLAERQNGSWQASTLGVGEQHFGIRLIVKDTTAGGGSGSAPASSLSVPYFAVDPNTGVVSLYAVRNVTANDVNIAPDYFMPDGTTVNGPVEVLKAGATKTVNFGDVMGLPADGNGVVVGAAAISVVDAAGNALQTAALTGDYFFVDPVNNFATGDPLLNGGCNRSTTRFADGGVFDGTTFTIAVPGWVASAAPGFDSPTGSAPLVSVVVYDEPGNVVDNATLGAASGIINVTTADLVVAGLSLPTFGSIEWTLEDNQKGYFTWAMNAGGKFSVGMAGACLD